MRLPWSCLLSSVLCLGCAQGHNVPPATARLDASGMDAGDRDGSVSTDASVDSDGSASTDASVDGGRDSGTTFDAGPMCPTGQALCDGACRDLTVDPGHCGGCTVRCAAGSLCASGVCMVSCPGGTTGCGGGCVDTATDEANCGACAAICGAGEACMASRCVSFCAPGEVYCTDHCVDTHSDAMNCGGCGLACVRIHASAVCVTSGCRVNRCETGFADCDGSDANGCERSVSCMAGSSCMTSCGTTGSRDCGDGCAPTCAPPTETCNALDDDCDGVCDQLSGCRTGIYRSWDPTLPGGNGGHIYTKELAVAQEPPDRVIEATNFFWVYTSDPGGFVPLSRCRLSSTGATNFLAAGGACEGAGVVVETLGYVAPSASCGAVPLYRLYSDVSGDHFYTPSAAERDAAIASFGYRLEGIAAYVFLAEHG